MKDCRIEDCKGFQWDDGNADKNLLKHGVPSFECEEIFFNRPLIFHADFRHSDDEPRYFALGWTNTERLLFIVFTIRTGLIRVISARDMTEKERRVFNGAKERDA